VQVQVFLSFVPLPIPERRIKDSRANNLQVEINSQGQRNRTCLDNQLGGSEQTISAERRIKRSAERRNEEREVKDLAPIKIRAVRGQAAYDASSEYL
jgi:hypothetical protein